MSEGESEYRKGVKALRTGLFKWKPDLPGAAIHFEAAAKAFEVSRNVEGAINAYEQLAQVNEQMNEFSNWAAGRSYESLSILALRNEKYPKAVEATSKAVEVYRLSGNGEKALRMYTFIASEFFSKGIVELANKMYASAINLISDEGLFVYAKDVVMPYVSLLLENNLLKDAMVIYQKELVFAQSLQRDHYINKAIFCILALTILDNPSIREDVFRDMCKLQCFPMSSEFTTISDLYDAYNEGNQEKFDKAARKATWNSVEAPLVRQIRAVKLVEKIQEEEDERFNFK